MVKITCNLTAEYIDEILASEGRLRGHLRKILVEARARADTEDALAFVSNDDERGIDIMMGAALLGTARQYGHGDGRAYWQVYIRQTQQRLRAATWPKLRLRIIDHAKAHDLI